ncbi:B-cell CLL/lymphoma 9 protein-like isoform X2 [Branchiostoma floridae]|uniref:B-cell CLL/lymphoma 9 protein-like isoform X2 n=1 Tax=Branchiostoma floridae TaxID=7739 RepID=A0A9J7KR09_BRAFL|nr:B-cell CLL/lymphoma 9 protein-like isoform X2 [Branchiostoma floridae]
MPRARKNAELEARQDLRGAWELVQVAQFLRLFRQKLGFADINTQRLEAELRQRDSAPLADTLARLLRYLFTRTDIRLGSWEADVKRVLTETGSQWKPFASGASYADMDPYQRLVFLKGVADHVFEQKVDELSEYLDETYDPEDMRAVPIGQDSLKNTYWYFDDLRLYKETVGRKGEKWECVCSNLKEWTSFVKKFRKSSHPQEKELYEFLHGQLLPLILGPLQTLEGLSQDADRRRFETAEFLRREEQEVNQVIHPARHDGNNITRHRGPLTVPSSTATSTASVAPPENMADIHVSESEQNSGQDEPLQREADGTSSNQFRPVPTQDGTGPKPDRTSPKPDRTGPSHNVTSPNLNTTSPNQDKTGPNQFRTGSGQSQEDTASSDWSSSDLPPLKPSGKKRKRETSTDSRDSSGTGQSDTSKGDTRTPELMGPPLAPPPSSLPPAADAPPLQNPPAKKQQQYAYIFSTELANKAAEAVLQGRVQSIVAFHIEHVTRARLSRMRHSEQVQSGNPWQQMQASQMGYGSDLALNPSAGPGGAPPQQLPSKPPPPYPGSASLEAGGTEGLTPEQLRHRQERLMTIQRMHKLLFPEQAQTAPPSDSLAAQQQLDLASLQGQPLGRGMPGGPPRPVGPGGLNMQQQPSPGNLPPNQMMSPHGMMTSQANMMTSQGWTDPSQSAAAHKVAMMGLGSPGSEGMGSPGQLGDDQMSAAQIEWRRLEESFYREKRKRMLEQQMMRGGPYGGQRYPGPQQFLPQDYDGPPDSQGALQTMQPPPPYQDLARLNRQQTGFSTSFSEPYTLLQSQPQPQGAPQERHPMLQSQPQPQGAPQDRNPLLQPQPQGAPQDRHPMLQSQPQPQGAPLDGTSPNFSISQQLQERARLSAQREQLPQYAGGQPARHPARPPFRHPTGHPAAHPGGHPQRFMYPMQDRPRPQVSPSQQSAMQRLMMSQQSLMMSQQGPMTSPGMMSPDGSDGGLLMEFPRQRHQPGSDMMSPNSAASPQGQMPLGVKGQSSGGSEGTPPDNGRSSQQSNQPETSLPSNSQPNSRQPSQMPNQPTTSHLPNEPTTGQQQLSTTTQPSSNQSTTAQPSVNQPSTSQQLSNQTVSSPAVTSQPPTFAPSSLQQLEQHFSKRFMPGFDEAPFSKTTAISTTNAMTSGSTTVTMTTAAVSSRTGTSASDGSVAMAPKFKAPPPPTNGVKPLASGDNDNVASPHAAAENRTVSPAGSSPAQVKGQGSADSKPMSPAVKSPAVPQSAQQGSSPAPVPSPKLKRQPSPALANSPAVQSLRSPAPGSPFAQPLKSPMEKKSPKIPPPLKSPSEVKSPMMPQRQSPGLRSPTMPQEAGSGVPSSPAVPIKSPAVLKSPSMPSNSPMMQQVKSPMRRQESSPVVTMVRQEIPKTMLPERSQVIPTTMRPLLPRQPQQLDTMSQGQRLAMMAGQSAMLGQSSMGPQMSVASSGQFSHQMGGFPRQPSPGQRHMMGRAAQYLARPPGGDLENQSRGNIMYSQSQLVQMQARYMAGLRQDTPSPAMVPPGMRQDTPAAAMVSSQPRPTFEPQTPVEIGPNTEFALAFQKRGPPSPPQNRFPSPQHSQPPHPGDPRYSHPGDMQFSEPQQVMDARYPHPGDSRFPHPGERFPQPGENRIPHPGDSRFPHPGDSRFPHPAERFPHPREERFSHPGDNRFPHPGDNRFPHPGVSRFPQQGNQRYPHPGERYPHPHPSLDSRFPHPGEGRYGEERYLAQAAGDSRFVAQRMAGMLQDGLEEASLMDRSVALQNLQNMLGPPRSMAESLSNNMEAFPGQRQMVEEMRSQEAVQSMLGRMMQSHNAMGNAAMQKSGMPAGLSHGAMQGPRMTTPYSTADGAMAAGQGSVGGQMSGGQMSPGGLMFKAPGPMGDAGMGVPVQDIQQTRKAQRFVLPTETPTRTLQYFPAGKPAERAPHPGMMQPAMSAPNLSANQEPQKRISFSEENLMQAGVRAMNPGYPAMNHGYSGYPGQ